MIRSLELFHDILQNFSRTCGPIFGFFKRSIRIWYFSNSTKPNYPFKFWIHSRIFLKNPWAFKIGSMQRFVKAFKFKSLELFQNFVNFSKDFSRTFWPSILDLCKDLSRITNSIKVLSFIHFKIFRKPLGFQNCIHIRISKAIRL